MTTNEIKTAIITWNNWASNPHVQRYDIALLKIWIQFERFISELIITYSTGQPSEMGYLPTLKIRFQDEEQFNAFMREGNKKYVEYLSKIEKLSKHIFIDDPFDVIFLDATNKTAYEQLKALRNYIAHESGEAKSKLINLCFSGNTNNFLEPNNFLLTRERSTRNTYYTYYTTIIQNIVELLVDPPS